LKIILKEENYCLRSAFSCAEALKEIKDEAPDLLLLDLPMPEMDGFGLLDKLRREEGSKSIPVIVLTAADLTQSEKRSLTENVKGVIIKGQKDRA